MENEKIEALINDLVPDLKPAVDEIEKSVATTQNHYGNYMALFGMVCKGNKQVGSIVYKALQRAGANQTGLSNAFRLSF